jgi:hypothetical protein
MATKKTATKKATSKKSAKKVISSEATVGASITVAEEPQQPSPSVADSDERIDLGNEVLSAVNESLSAMTRRGVSPQKVEEAFYIAFQFAFCDFLRVTGFSFDAAISDLRDMYQRDAQQSQAN